MYYLYILISTKYKKTYVGITDNPTRRLMEHNRGESNYTKRYIPWIILYTEKYKSRILARKREKYFKSAIGRKWIKNNLIK
jgi:putative endonuclease